jgi:hypothetical protein
VTGIDRDPGGRVTAVRAADASFPCAAVIVALPWRAAARLLPDVVPAADERLVGSPITAVHLWFDRDVIDLPHAVLVGRVSQWAFRGDSPGHCQVVISASRDLLGGDRDALLDRVVAEIRDVFPAARAARLLASRIVTDPTAVLSVRPGVEAVRPAPRTAVPGLFLAGDWTATGWPSTMEGAVRRGRRQAAADAGRRSPPGVARAARRRLTDASSGRQRAAQVDEGRGEGSGVHDRMLVQPPQVDGGAGPAADRRQGRAQPAQRRLRLRQPGDLRRQVLRRIVGDHPHRGAGQSGGRRHAGHRMRLHVDELSAAAGGHGPLRFHRRLDLVHRHDRQRTCISAGQERQWTVSRARHRAGGADHAPPGQSRIEAAGESRGDEQPWPVAGDQPFRRPRRRGPADPRDAPRHAPVGDGALEDRQVGRPGLDAVRDTSVEGIGLECECEHDPGRAAVG